jgi:hypothetical protein
MMRSKLLTHFVQCLRLRKDAPFPLLKKPRYLRMRVV